MLKASLRSRIACLSPQFITYRCDRSLFTQMAAPPKRTKMAGAPPELLSEPPSALSEPLIYLSARQALECGKRAGLSRFADHLPGWVPATVIAEALGFSDEGIRRAIQYTGGPYLWATEFENVHTLWEYAEPDIVIGGKRFAGSEAYYHSQKPVPFDDAKWLPMRVEVMRTAVRAKFAAAADARALLMATHPHPLLSIKGDCFWGFDARHGGENKLAELLMELRSELVAGGGPLPSEAVEPSTPPLFTLSGSGSTRAMAVVWSSILPHLPPRVQQQLATGSETEKLEIEARVLKVVEDGSGHKCQLETLKISNAPWTVTSSSPSRSTTSPFSVSPSSRRLTPLSSQSPSVSPSTTPGMVSSEPVDGLVTSWPPPTTSDLSSDTLSTSALDPNTFPSLLVSSINSLPSLSELKTDELPKPSTCCA